MRAVFGYIADNEKCVFIKHQFKTILYWIRFCFPIELEV